MKKILLTAAAVSVLATSSAYAMENSFYVKANAGWSKLNKIDDAKSNNDVHVGAGVGYHVMDKVRVDLTFDHFVNPTFKGSNGNTLKLNINTLLLNAFVNVFEVDSFKFFVGAGVGGSALKNFNAKKNLYRLAYAGYVGVENEFSSDVTGELSYSYRGFDAAGGDSDDKHVLKSHQVTAGVRFNF